MSPVEIYPVANEAKMVESVAEPTKPPERRLPPPTVADELEFEIAVASI